MTLWQRKVAVNDRAYIPGLLREFPGIELREIMDLRRLDRRVQGLGHQDEQRAHSDFLWSEGPVEDVLLCSPNQWQYSGPLSKSLAAQVWPEIHWSGGSPHGGYFCITNPSSESQAAIRGVLGW